MDNIEDIEMLNSEEAFDRELLLEQENDFEIQLEKDENPQFEDNYPPHKRKLKREVCEVILWGPKNACIFGGRGGKRGVISFRSHFAVIYDRPLVLAEK